MFTVYGMADSGNCYKVKLALEQLGKPYRWVEVDSTRGETRSKEFLARNPNGKVPTLQLEDGRTLHKTLEGSLGNLKRPLSDAQLETKFRDQATVLPPAQREAAMAACWSVETLGDSRELIDRCIPA